MKLKWTAGQLPIIISDFISLMTESLILNLGFFQDDPVGQGGGRTRIPNRGSVGGVWPKAEKISDLPDFDGGSSH